MATTAQHMEALAHANEVRTGVAEFRREIAGLDRHDAILAVIDLIESRHDDRLLGAAKVRQILMAVTGFGEDKARRLMIAAQVYSGEKRLRDLTARQRGLLATILTSEGWKKSRRRSR
jgi:hypothetical protein